MNSKEENFSLDFVQEFGLGYQSKALKGSVLMSADEIYGDGEFGDSV